MDSFFEAVIVEDPVSDGRKNITGAFFGLTLSLLGSAVFWMWMKKRRFISTESSQESQTKLKNPTFTHSYDNDDDDTCSKDPNCVEDSNAVDGMDIRIHQARNLFIGHEHERSPSAQSVGASVNQQDGMAHLRYEPALIRTESNIEVPETPVTAFTINRTNFTPHAETKAEDGTAVQRYIDIQKTPHTGDGGSGCVLVESTPTSGGDLGDNTSIDVDLRQKKKSRFPMAFISPFRRIHLLDTGKMKSEGCHDEYEVSSESGGILVGGKQLTNHTSYRPHNKRQIATEQPTNEPPIKVPSIIGGPNSIPSLVKSPEVGDGTVDIVDEVAYLYSTNNGDIGASSSPFTASFSATEFKVSSAGGDSDDDTNIKPTNVTNLTRNTARVVLPGKRNRPSFYFSDESDNDDIEIYHDDGSLHSVATQTAAEKLRE